MITTDSKNIVMTSPIMKYYKLKNKQLPWGDYGEILFAGYNIQDKESGDIYISRTAPFLPSIYRDPREKMLFITNPLKTKLEKSSLIGLSFQKVIKDRIVSLAWEKWDLSAPEPAFYPSGDMDAEEYIIRRKHNKKLADAMKNIWAVKFPTKGLATREGELIIQSIGNSDIFSVEINAGILSENIFVSEKAMLWLSELGENNLIFEPCATKKATSEEIEELEDKVKEQIFRKIKEDKMSKKDWQLWHRLINEANKLIDNISSAKQDKTKVRWKNKALNNLLQARELYPLNDIENQLLKSLKE